MAEDAGSLAKRRIRELTPESIHALQYCELPDPDRWLAWWQTEAAWRREEIQLFGKNRPVPRLLSWYGDAGLNYRYSGTDHPCEGWPPALNALRRWTEKTCRTEFNFVLANRYRDGRDSMGWHADDEPELIGDVCSISLGASRRFLLDTPEGRCALRLGHGQVIRLPRSWRHSLPKTSKPVGDRINLTFRRLRDHLTR